MVDPLSCPNPLHAPYLFCLPLSVSPPPPFFFSFLPPKPSPTSFTPHEHSCVAQCHLLSCSLPIWVTGAALHWPAAELYGGSKVRSLICMECSTAWTDGSQIAWELKTVLHTQAHTSLETFKEICALPLLLRWEYHCRVDGKALPVVSQFSLQGVKLSS